jgi:hypothetical protein
MESEDGEEEPMAKRATAGVLMRSSSEEKTPASEFEDEW